MTARAWTVELNRSTPMSLNDRTHWRVRAIEVASLREGTARLVRKAGIPPLGKVEIELHYAPKTRRRIDAPNLVPTRKHAEDGVVDAGVIPDDTSEFSVPLMPVIHPATGETGRLWLVIREVLEAA